MVIIEKCPDYDIDNVLTALSRIFDSLGGIGKYVRPGTKVLLKPNLLMKKHPDAAVTTHPSLVKALAVLIKQAGGTVTVADSPGGPHSQMMLKMVYSACGMEKVAKETGAALNYNLEEAEVENPGGRYLKKVTVMKPLADADLVINLPKLKTHGQMVLTGAVKNMFGAVPGVQKVEYHFRMPEYDEFANALIDIFLSVKPALNIMDAVVGMDGHGPSAGDPKQIGLIMAGENAFELDFIAMKVINADPGDVQIIRHAIDRGLCPGSLDGIELAGEDINSVRIVDFNIPQLDGLKAVQFFDRGILKYLINVLRPKPVFYHKACVGCADCERNCPAHIIEMRNNRPVADLSGCIRCFCCQELCPARAIFIKRPFLARLIIKRKKHGAKRKTCMFFKFICLAGEFFMVLYNMK